jgi:cardiolipin synthase
VRSYLEGPAAGEMAAVFEQGWSRAGGAPIGLERRSSSAASGAQVLVLDSRPGRGSEEAAAVLAAIVGAARKTLWLTTAYFAPRTRALAILGSAANRGVDVRLLVPGRTDVRLVRHAGHGFFSGLLSRGVRIFEYQPAILHAKTLVADGLVSVIGSSNLDFRSFELNTECNFVIVDAPTGKRMEAAFLEDLTRSEEIRHEAWRHWDRARVRSHHDQALVVETLAHEATLQWFLEHNPTEARTAADAALAASIFHYGTYTVNQLKEELDRRGIPVRVAV